MSTIQLKKPNKLKEGDTVAIVSLSSGMLGEPFCKHNLELGEKRLNEMGLNLIYMPNALKGIDYLEAHPEKRAEDLKKAFQDPEINGIICAIGGNDTYRTLPYLMDDDAFIDAVNKHPKLFLGFSDTTVNHLMFHKLGLQTFYGQAFLPDLAELSSKMLPYSKEAFLTLFEGMETRAIHSSDVWYEERTDFSELAIGTEHVMHKEVRGFELIQGSDHFEGELLGGCLDSLYEMIAQGRHADQTAICSKYQLFPDRDTWRGKILFLETSEETPNPQYIEKALRKFKELGVFEEISGIIFGKPQDEVFYEEYKIAIKQAIGNETLPVLYNVNIGHALPRAILPYGALVRVDAKQNKISFVK